MGQSKTAGRSLLDQGAFARVQGREKNVCDGSFTVLYSLISSTSVSYKKLGQKMIAAIFLFWASQEKQRTGRPQLAKLQLPVGSIPRPIVTGGTAGDRVCFGVISWMKGHEHYSDLCIIGVRDFLFTLLYLSTLFFQVCWQKNTFLSCVKQD